MRLLIVVVFVVFTQAVIAQQDSIFLWQKGMEPYAIPGASGGEQKDKFRISKVEQPCIFPFLPEEQKRNGKAVIICPGGGYRFLAYRSEGFQVAEWFKRNGYAAFVLKYRLPDKNRALGNEMVPKSDLRKAALLVRERATDWGIDEQGIGFMGFSAGGHLASTGATHTEEYILEQDTLPAFQPAFNVLVYPVISMENGVTHAGSKVSLLGKKPSEDIISKYSTDQQVKADTAPTFLIGSSDDEVVPIKNSLLFYEALVNHGVYAEMHLYPFGGHGYGFGKGKTYLTSWNKDLLVWLGNLD